MLQTEFEERYGKRVTPSEYRDIEQVYMAAEGINKDIFCKEWKVLKLGDSNVIQGLMMALDNEKINRQQWQHTAEQEREIKELRISELQTALIAQKELAEELDQLRAEHVNLAKALVRGGLEDEAEKILGRAKVIAIKAIEKVPFNQADMDFIVTTFSK